MATHNMGFTYTPKIEAVKDGRCTQTIRYVNKRTIKEGDFLNLFTWSSKPYRSPWSWRLKVRVREVITISVTDYGVRCGEWEKPWDSYWIRKLSEHDFIDPPTGAELKKVLEGMHGALKGQVFQIIRW